MAILAPHRSTPSARASTARTPSPPTPDNIFGVLSLVFWSLIIVITIKYVIFILRADNRGEGGILALTALATPIRPLAPSPRRPLVLVGVFGAATDQLYDQIVQILQFGLGTRTHPARSSGDVP